MKIFWAPKTRSARALWMLEEAGVDYERQLIDLQSPERQKNEEFLEARQVSLLAHVYPGGRRALHGGEIQRRRK
jgi:glutathione S-transferase